MGDIDDSFSAFPGAATGQVAFAVFGNNDMRLGPGNTDYRPQGKHGYNAGTQAALLILVAGGTADDSLAASRTIGAGNEIQLPARPAYMTSARRL